MLLKKLSSDTYKISHLKKQKLFNKRLQYIVSCIYDSFLNIWVSLILQYTTSEHIHVHDSENHARSSVTIVSSILVSLGCKFAPHSSPNQLWTHINRTKIMCILTVILVYLICDTKKSNRVEVRYSNSNHKLRQQILSIFTHLESTYHASVIPWIYFGSAIIGYILVLYLYLYIQQLIFAFFDEMLPYMTLLPHSMPFLRLLYDSWFSRSWWQVLWFVCSNGFHYIISKKTAAVCY